MFARGFSLFVLAGLLIGGCRPAQVVKTSTPPAAAPARPAGTNDASAVPAPGLPDAELTLGTPDVAPACAGACQPGQSCQQGACLDDCRPESAVACTAPTICDFITGRCVPPNAGCVLTGTPVVCGGGEFPPRCGPGARCDVGSGCVADQGCARVVCDAANFCRGADCPQSGGGGVRQVALDPIADATAGSAGGVVASAGVMADALCGLSVTFELRKDLELFVSAYNDSGIWRVPFPGAPSLYITEKQPIGGVTADRTGALYYTLQDSGAIRRVPAIVGGTPAPQDFVAPSPTLRGLARMTFGPDGLLYAVADRKVVRFSAAGAVTQTWEITGSTFLTGLAFDRAGGLLAGQHWPTVWRLPPAGMTFAVHLDATPVVAPNTNTPWNEGMALGPDGAIYVGVFPSGNLDGVVYTIDEMARARRLLGLTEMRRDVPATQFAGVHGVAFGVDGTLYFANQNTATSTREAVGQVLALRPTGKIELVASGLNFDWPRGFDGDIVVSQATVASVSAPIDAAGRARGSLDAPATPGIYGVRVLVTDPRTGAISEARGSVRVR